MNFLASFVSAAVFFPLVFVFRGFVVKIATTATNEIKFKRIPSIDILRGLVMILMALDHVRDFIYPISPDPTDIAETYPALFFTRWITHFCAPIFIFLAGTSGFLWETTKGKSKKELSWLFLTRGLWLMAVEVVIINPLWTFQLDWSFTILQVIWTIGLSMVVMSALVFVPWKWLLAICVSTIVLHNTLDGINFGDSLFAQLLWGTLHDSSYVQVTEGWGILLGYPLIPWFAVMGLGYCFARIFQLDPEPRKKFLVWAGVGAILAFALIRAANIYGDPGPWSPQGDPLFTFLSFLNTEKYPPSLLFLLMTLGPAMLFLAWTEKLGGKVAGVVSLYGKVPFFYYILHFFLAHFSALLIGVFLGYPATDFLAGGWDFPESFNFGLPVVYLVWVIVVAILYAPCLWFANLKKRKNSPWLTYF